MAAFVSEAYEFFKDITSSFLYRSLGAVLLLILCHIILLYYYIIIFQCYIIEGRNLYQ